MDFVIAFIKIGKNSKDDSQTFIYFSILNDLVMNFEKTEIWSHSVQSQSISFLLLKTKNFHFIDSKVLICCQKCCSILTSWALVRVVEVYIARVGIWCIGNLKIMAPSKCWSIATGGIHSISFLSSYQRHLCWWQTGWVDKTEQERNTCSFVTCRA